jgi:hypothetical protein
MLKGSYSIYFARPAEGKSEFIKEMVLNTAEFSGWKWALCTPESGAPAMVLADYAHGYLRKPFLKPDSDEDNLVEGKDYASPQEAERALTWLSEHVYIIDPGLEDISVQDVYAQVEAYEKEHGVKFDGVVIDPYTEMSPADPSEAIHERVNTDLNTIRKWGVKHNVHTILSVHTAKVEERKFRLKQQEWYYVPEPGFQELSGGQNWSRKGFMMLSVWRTPFHVDPWRGEYGYRPMQTQWNVQKAKPKSAGKNGTGFLYYDVFQGRYYEGYRDEEGNMKRRYSYDDPHKYKDLTLDFDE